VDFLFVIIELFSLDVTAEALRANIDCKSAFLKRVRQFRSNFHVIFTIFAQIHVDRPLIALQHCS